MRSFGRRVAVVAAVVLAGGIGPQAAGAAPARPKFVTTSTYVAGYGSQPAAGISKVTTRFTVPAVTCASSSDVETLAPGVGMVTNTGAVTTTATLRASCNLGSISYSTAVCPGDSSFCVSGDAKPGDILVATIVNGLSPGPVATMRNLTSKTLTKVAGTFIPFNVFSLIGDIGPHWLVNETAIPTFTSIKFTRAEVNGSAQGGVYVSQLDLDGNGDVQIKTANIKATSETFKTTFVANY